MNRLTISRVADANIRINRKAYVSLFIGMGKAEQQVHANSDGTCRSRRMMPLGIVIDERIASGAEYAIAVSEMCNYVAHPELLEVPGDKFVSECDFLPMPPPPKRLPSLTWTSGQPCWTGSSTKSPACP